MPCGDIVEWVAEKEGTIIATAAIVFYKFLPTYLNKSGIKGYVTSMYTAPEYRRMGIAVSLMDRLVQEAQSRHVEKLWLGASKLGRPVYLKYGFAEATEWLELNDLLNKA